MHPWESREISMPRTGQLQSLWNPMSRLLCCSGCVDGQNPQCPSCPQGSARWDECHPRHWGAAETPWTALVCLHTGKKHLPTPPPPLGSSARRPGKEKGSFYPRAGKKDTSCEVSPARPSALGDWLAGETRAMLAATGAGGDRGTPPAAGWEWAEPPSKVPGPLSAWEPQVWLP